MKRSESRSWAESRGNASSILHHPRGERRSRADLAAALRAVGLERGDVVYCHVDFAALGPLWNHGLEEEHAAALLAALFEVLGEEGTLLVPSYTFSFCRNEVFDPANTPADAGPWNPSRAFLELVRTRPDAVRSIDPIHSVAGIGPLATSLLAGVPGTCFGADSVHDRLHGIDGKICLIGLPLEEATFRHHVEEMVGVPFRYRKLFTGQIREDGGLRKRGWLYSVRILAGNGYPDGRSLEAEARAADLYRTVPLGTGEVGVIGTRDFFGLAAEALTADPWHTARGPAGDPVTLEDARVGSSSIRVELPASASMHEMIRALWWLRRDIVSDGYDAALRALATQLPMLIHEHATGTECWTWIVPEKWTCHEAYLATEDGRRIFSYADHPLHVVSYSLPFNGVVTREELLEHLHVHPRLEDAIPFEFKYYERDWGLCCSRRQRDALTDARYRVVIRSSFSYGTLKVGEVVVPGISDETIMLCAHLCHPAMVNDDLTGIVVAVDVMRELLRRPRPYYTYRLTIVPETIGSVAYLARHTDLLSRLKGGLFLEMLGRDHPHSLQLSFEGQSQLDRCFNLALQQGDPRGWTGPFRSIIGNDERQYNAPGVRVPMLSLSRVLPASSAEHPYREYHSSLDTPQLVPAGALEESRDLVLRMIETLEADAVVVNRFEGEPFCSRYGLHIDAYRNPEGNRALFDLIFLMDGTRTISEMAVACGIPFDAARNVVDELRAHGLVELRR
jgi:aminopeptidase-like protein/aminoglycoside N3'-acetyltransferase